MTWCSCNDRLVSFGNLSLQVIKLLQVLGQALVVAFLLHVVHGAEVCAIAPVLPMVWDHINGTSQSVLVHRADSTTDFVAKAWRQRVESVFFVQVDNTQTT